MNTAEIDKILRSICGDMFIGVFARDRLPNTTRRPALMVINTDPVHQPGTHWTAVYIDKEGYGEHFDSLGQPPNKTVEGYMKRYCRRWIISERQLQTLISRYCGHYCVFYCCYRSIGYDLNTITSWFTHDTGLNCMLVHQFVCRRLNK
jgi:hypothetical protein